MNAILAWFVSLLAIFFPGLEEQPGNGRYFGYAEGEFVIVATREGGTVLSVNVRDGQRVEAGEVLVQLDHERNQQLVSQGEARLASAQALLQDKESGSREEEIAVIEARLNAASTELVLARDTLIRTEALVMRKHTPESRLDRDRAAFDEAQATITRLRAELAVARLPERKDRIDAARQDVVLARAELENRITDLEERTILAPSAGHVDRVIRRAGEYAGPGASLVSLLPDGAVKIRFYVPEESLHTVVAGKRVLVDCDGCERPLPALISFVSPEAEFTPPVMYSMEERHRLVFLIEARFEEDSALVPGQPVDVRMAP